MGGLKEWLSDNLRYILIGLAIVLAGIVIVFAVKLTGGSGKKTSDSETVILYGSYARGDYKADSDIDIMILLDLSDMDIKQYRHELSGETYDFNMDYDLDIKPIAKSQQHFQKWVDVYPFYANVKKEGVKLFDAA